MSEYGQGPYFQVGEDGWENDLRNQTPSREDTMNADRARAILVAVRLRDDALEKVRAANEAENEPPSDAEAIALAEEFGIAEIALDTALKPEVS